MKVRIYLEGELKPETLVEVLTPENETVPEFNIQTKVKDDGVLTDFSGTMSIGTLLRTLDDIILTASLSENVGKEASID